MPTKMSGSSDQKSRKIRGKESEKNGGWKEKEGKTGKEMGDGIREDKGQTIILTCNDDQFVQCSIQSVQ